MKPTTIQTKKLKEPTKELIAFAEDIANAKSKLKAGTILKSEKENYCIKIVDSKEYQGSARVAHESTEIQLGFDWLNRKYSTANFIYYQIIWCRIKIKPSIIEDKEADARTTKHYLKVGKPVKDLVLGLIDVFMNSIEWSNFRYNRKRYNDILAIIQAEFPTMDLSKFVMNKPKQKSGIAYPKGMLIYYKTSEKSKKQLKLIHHVNDDGTYDLRDDEKLVSKIIENVASDKITPIQSETIFAKKLIKI